MERKRRRRQRNIVTSWLRATAAV